jgi:predicted molibdopterin-dependent oxidoreductase YjgC
LNDSSRSVGYSTADPAGDSPDQWLTLTIDGRDVAVPRGTLVAAALERAAPGHGARVSPGGMRRLPFCGMGVCGECRVTIDGRPHRLGCQVVCAAGMEVCSDA